MAKFRVYQFFRAAGTNGGGSVIFAFVLFAFGVWEHTRQKNVPASWLVACGVASFCLGSYRAWLQEVVLKEEAIKRNDLPHFLLTLPGWTFDFDVTTGKTVFFMAVTALNTGCSSCLYGWKVLYAFGSDLEVADTPHLISPMEFKVADCLVSYSQDDLINTKTRTNAVGRGSLVDGRLFFTLNHDRRDQQKSGLVKVTISCQDFTGKIYTEDFVPSTIRPTSVQSMANEKVKRILLPSETGT